MNTTLNQWEQLVWQDIQSEGLDDAAVCKSSAGNTDRGQKSHTSSPAASSLSDHRPQDVHLVAAAGDAGSGCLATGVEAATASGPQQAGSGDVMPPPPDQEVNPFACPENQRLSGAPSGCLHGSCPDSLKPTASLVTFKTKALAAAAGSVRSGAVGSSLRMASIMYRSSSGGLADTLLSEQARAESGLLTAGLGRSDSLPELSLLPSALELSELISLRELDQLAGLSTSSGLPSLSLLFGEATADAQQAAHAAPAAPPFMDDVCVPLEMTSSKMLGRPSSFTANSAVALFAGSAAMVRPHLPVQHPAPQVPPSSQHPALRPPAILDYSPMVRLEQAAQGFQAPAAAGPSALHGYPGLGAAPTSAAGGAEPAFEGFSFPSLGRMPLLMDRQDTFDVLIKQVDQELTAEAQIQQYAALEFDTMDIPLAPAGPDMGASMVQSPFINASAASAAAAAAAVVPAVLRAAAQPGVGGEVIKRRSVFEGHPAGLVPSGVSAVSGASACTTAAGLDPTGPSFASWVAPADPSTSSFTSSAPAASASPFCLPSHTGIVPAADSSAMAEDGAAEAVSAAVAAAVGGTVARGKQEVARYSRVITCKTYLKRLNITQPMAEHLLPHHDLNPPTPKAAAATAEADGEGEGKRPASSYEALFKEFITVVDEAGASFKVQYEGVCCNAQKHLRLTSGWRDYIRAHAVEVGDTVVFERRGNERSVLYVTLVKAADGPVDVEPDAKKRRITRKQAVQRLS